MSATVIVPREVILSGGAFNTSTRRSSCMRHGIGPKRARSPSASVRVDLRRGHEPAELGTMSAGSQLCKAVGV